MRSLSSYEKRLVEAEEKKAKAQKRYNKFLNIKCPSADIEGVIKFKTITPTYITGLNLKKELKCCILQVEQLRINRTTKILEYCSF